MSVTITLLLLAVAGPPPLSPSQLTRLETARDGTDHREAAFLALVESLAAWDGAIGDTPVRLRPDLEAMLADPEACRGDLCLLRGVIQQRATLAAPYGVAQEWFLRSREGVPFLVYVVDGDRVDAAAFRPGRHVEIGARFYKRASFEARDGMRRDYPAFVGAGPRLVDRTSGDLDRLWIITTLLVTLLVVFAVLLIVTRRRGPRRLVRLDATALEHDPASLPDDPEAALAELRRRAAEGDDGVPGPPDAARGAS